MEDTMAGGIYLVQQDNSLVELGEHGYVIEAVLQRYLADYPHLMAGDQIDPDSPRPVAVTGKASP